MGSIFLVVIFLLVRALWLCLRFVIRQPFRGVFFVGPGTIGLDPTFESFIFIKTGFTLDELISLVKMFRLFSRLEQIFWCSECGHSK